MNRRMTEELAKLQLSGLKIKETLRVMTEKADALNEEEEADAKEMQEAELLMSTDVRQQVQEADWLEKKVKEKETAYRRLRESLAEQTQENERQLKEVEILTTYGNLVEKVTKIKVDILKVAIVQDELHLSQLKEALEHYTATMQLLEMSPEPTMTPMQIKSAILDLFEKTGGAVGEDGVDVNGIDVQMEWVERFINNLYDNNIAEQHDIGGQKEVKMDSPQTKSEEGIK